MPESAIIPSFGQNSQIVRKTFFAAGQDDYTEAPAQDADLFELLENIMPPINGTLDRRWGTSEFSNPNIRARRMFSVYFPVSYDANGAATGDPGRLRVILTASNGSGNYSGDNIVVVINHNGAVINPHLYMPTAGADHPHCTMANTYVYFADGTAAGLKSWNGYDPYSAQPWGLTPLNWTPPAVTINKGGDLTLRQGRKYTIAGRNSKTGAATLARDSVTGLVPFTEISGPVENGYITFPLTAIAGAPQNLLSVLLAQPEGIDEFILLATADGGDTSTLYQVLKMSVSGLGALHIYSDNKTEEVLLSESNIWAEIDADGNGRGLYAGWNPATIIPTGKYPTYYRGRMYLMKDNKLYYSASLDQVTTSTGLVASRPEMVFNASQVIELSTQDNENGVGLLADGGNLYIGTVQGIKYLSGDPPNHDGPTTLYYGVGIANPQTWRKVYHAGKATGAIWLTPDRKVIASDGNGYRDIGKPVQGTLDLATSTAFADKAHAAFITDGAQELYVLAIPYNGATECNQLLVYNISLDKWVTWVMTGYQNGVTARTTNVLALNGEQVPWLTPYNIGGPIGYFSSGTYTQLFKFRFDNTADFPNAPDVNDYVSGSQANGLPTRAVIRTTWWDFGAPHMHTFLRSLDIMSAESVSNITLKVEGADSVAAFSSPTVLSNTTMRSGMHGKQFYPLASIPGKYRFYRFTLTFAPTATQDVLNYLSIKFRNTHLI